MVRRTGTFLVFALSLASVASAQVAMLTQVAGGVKVSGKEAARPAVSFLKVDDGDTLTLDASARVQMVYLATGRQEVWKGAGAVTVGAQEGHSASLKPEVSTVPPIVLKQLAKVPAAGERGKTGMVMLRSLDDLGDADQLDEQYKQLRAAAPADDTTPEVFLLQSLLDLGEYDRARKVLGDLEAKTSAQPQYTAVVQHFTRLVAEAEAGRRK